MGYVISYQALRDIYSQMALVVNDTVNERIPKINEVLSEFIYNNNFSFELKLYITLGMNTINIAQ